MLRFRQVKGINKHFISKDITTARRNEAAKINHPSRLTDITTFNKIPNLYVTKNAGLNFAYFL